MNTKTNSPTVLEVRRCDDPNCPKCLTARQDARIAELEGARDVLRDALLVVCDVLAKERDGDPLPRGWVEEVKYQVVDRALEFIEPGFDGGTTSREEAIASIAQYRALLTKGGR